MSDIIAHRLIVSTLQKTYFQNFTKCKYVIVAPNELIKPHFHRDLVCAIAAVTEDTAHAAATRWLPGLFTSDTNTAIVCHPSKVVDMQTAFRKSVYYIHTYIRLM